ncbi:RTA1 like protein [Stagonosporopsis vannaccii]|nr:RTA1 like protein [Stagonosporopsis vannaccii]
MWPEMSTSPDTRFVPSYESCSEVSSTCPVEATLYASWFSKPGNMIFFIVFLLSLLYQLYILARYRNYSFSLFLGIGTVLELIGYIERYRMALNPWNFGAFKNQLSMLILAPTLIAAALSITFKHMVIYYGPEASILKPRLYPWIFLGTDVASIAIQIVGAAMSSSDDPSTMDTATVILTLGVAFQAANMVLCGSLMALYWYRLRKGGATRAQQLRAQDASAEQEDQKLRIYICGMVVAYVLIIVRCIYRIPEMAGGWGGDLMRDETTFLILDGAMIAVAVLTQTIIHPSIYFPAMKNGKAAAKLEKKAARKTRNEESDPESLELGGSV